MAIKRTFIELRKNLTKEDIKDIFNILNKFKPFQYRNNILGFEYDDKKSSRYLFRKELFKVWKNFVATTNIRHARKQFNNKQTVISLANSSNISSYAYNPYTQILTIQFEKGSQYQYQNVPNEVINKMLIAQEKKQSLGRVFIDEVKGKYKYNRVNTVVAP